MPGRLRDPRPFVPIPHMNPTLRAENMGPDGTVAELRRKAAEAGIVGRSRMRKDELISALRRH